MKIDDAMDIINGVPKGYMVRFEWKEGSMLRGDHFPDKHAGEKLIDTEWEAWVLASEFADKMRGRAVNLYVIDDKFKPVNGYHERYIKNR